jgi:iron(III) transport system substrate-binding protein
VTTLGHAGHPASARGTRSCRRGRRALRLGALTVTTLLASTVSACASGAPGESIVLYSGQHAQLTDALVTAFVKQTAVHVRVRTNDGIVLADQILQEGSSTPADVYLTENSPELVILDQHHRLARLPSSILEQIPSRYDAPTGDWAGMALRISSLVYDPSQLSSSKLPTSILDLAEPQWKGKVVVAPTDSDFPPIVGAVIATYGATTAKNWLTGIKRNSQVLQNEESVVAAVNRGDAACGLVNQYYWYRLQLEVGQSRMRSSLYYFPHGNVGSIENISGAAVLAATSRRHAAESCLRFLVSPAAQRIIAASDDFEYPARADTPANHVLPPLSSISSTTLSVVALGNDQVAAKLIQQSGLV